MTIIIASLILLPFLGALVSYAVGRKNKTARNIIAVATAGLELVLAICFLAMGAGVAAGVEALREAGEEIGPSESALVWKIPVLFGNGLSFSVDGFRGVYIAVAAFMWFMTTLYAPEYLAKYRNRNRYYLFTLFTLGATMGVFLSADLFTTFVFFEIMSFTSYVWVVADERKESLAAGATYLGVAVIGGLVLLMGLFLLKDLAGTLAIDDLRGALLGCVESGEKGRLYAAVGCIFFGFAAKAGAFPVHIWLPKAHPVAPAPASALLSGILTKAGVYGILIVSLRIFSGDRAWGKFLLVIALITMVTGAVLALFSVDLKRTLACSSMSQIGFILTGVAMATLLGEESAMAARGAFLHMVNHSMIKLVLFMAAGVVYMNVHKLNLNDIRGFGRKKPFLNVVFLLGALGIGGVPFFNGYVSKTMIHEAILEGAGFLNAPKLVEWLFLISGGLTVAYMTKLYVAIFVEKNKIEGVQKTFEEKKNYVKLPGIVALSGAAVVIPVLGVVPSLVSTRFADMAESFLGVEVPMEHAVHFYNLENLKGAAISLAVGAIVYFLIIRKLLMKDGRYLDAWPKVLDLEFAVYRPILLTILPAVFGAIVSVLDHLVDGIILFLRKTFYRDHREGGELEEGTIFTHLVGHIMDFLHDFLNTTVRKESPKADPSSYEHRLAMRHVKNVETRAVIGRSISFGLALATLGLLLTIGYMLFFLAF